MTTDPRLSHLDRLEAEGIAIIREVAAQFRNPVHALFDRQGFVGACCTSRGRRSLRRDCRFPLLHIDTTWKFRDMIAFRDRMAR